MIDGFRKGLPSEIAAVYAQKTLPTGEPRTQGFSPMGQQGQLGTFRTLGEGRVPASDGGFKTLMATTGAKVKTAQPLPEGPQESVKQQHGERPGVAEEAVIQNGAAGAPVILRRGEPGKNEAHTQENASTESAGDTGEGEVPVRVYPAASLGGNGNVIGEPQKRRWGHSKTGLLEQLKDDGNSATPRFHPPSPQGREVEHDEQTAWPVVWQSLGTETPTPKAGSPDELPLQEIGETTKVHASNSGNNTDDNPRTTDIQVREPNGEPPTTGAGKDSGRGGGGDRGSGPGSPGFPDEPIPEGGDGDSTIAVTLLREIKSLIQNRELAPGSQLLFPQTLAKEVGTSRAQILLVYRALEAEGLIERRGRAGSFVREKVTSGNNNVTRITKRLGTQIQKGDISPGTKLLSYKDLAELEGTDTNTARVSYIILESNGLIETRRTEGHFVRTDREEPPEQETIRLLQGINLTTSDRPILVPSVPVFRPSDEIPIPDPTIENPADQIRDLIRKGYRDTPIAAVMGRSQSNVNQHRSALSAAGENIPTQQRLAAEMHELILEGTYTDSEIATALGYQIQTVSITRRTIEEVPPPFQEKEIIDIHRMEQEVSELKDMVGRAAAGELSSRPAEAAFPDMQRLGILVTELLESATGLVSVREGTIGNTIDVSTLAKGAELDTQAFIESLAGIRYIDPNRIYRPLVPYFDEQAAQMQEISKITRSYNLLRTLSQDGLTVARAMEYLRMELNIGQDEFAPLFNMTRTNYVKFAQGTTIPLVKTLDTILEACNVDPQSREGQMFHLVRAGVKPMSSEDFTNASDAERVRYARTALGHYIKDFAAMLYIYELTLINYEAGKRPIPEDVRRGLTEIIGVRPDSPLGRVIIRPEKLAFNYGAEDFLSSPLLLQEHIPGEDKPYWLTKKEETVYRQMQRTPRLSTIVGLLMNNFDVHQKKVNQKELAAASHVHPNTIANILNDRPPREFILTRIYSAFGYDVYHPFTQYALQCLEELKRADADS